MQKKPLSACMNAPFHSVHPWIHAKTPWCMHARVQKSLRACVQKSLHAFKVFLHAKSPHWCQDIPQLLVHTSVQNLGACKMPWCTCKGKIPWL